MSNSNLGKIYAFDYLRAICCIVVVGIHTGIHSLLLGYKNLYNIIAYNVFDLAVPIFFQISLILFFLIREKQKDYFFKKRLYKIIKLYIFWGVFSELFFLAINEITMSSLIDLIDIRNLLIFIIKDGYSNPFYFFFSLLFLTTLAEVFAFYIDKTTINKELVCYSTLIFSCVIVFLLPLTVMLISEKFYILAQAFNPLNFTPYIFSSFLISTDLSKNKVNNNLPLNKKQICLLIILFISFAFFEWKYLKHPLLWGGVTEDALPAYSRLSLVFAAWLITLISIKVASEPHFIIKLFSDFSLGIYCLHTFLGILLFRIFSSQLYAKVLVFSITLLLATILTKFLKSFKILNDLV